MRLELYIDNAFPVSVLLKANSPLHKHTHVQPAGQTCTCTILTPILELNICVWSHGHCMLPLFLCWATHRYCFNFFLQTMLRIWDTFLYEGSKVLFRFAIAIFKYNEEALLSKDNSIAIFNHLRTMCQDATDVNRLVQVSWQQCLPCCTKYILTYHCHSKENCFCNHSVWIKKHCHFFSWGFATV